MPIPLALPLIPAFVKAVAAGTITAAGLAALRNHLNSDDTTTRYREEFGDQLRVAMPPSTSTASTGPSVPYSPIIEEYRYTPGDGLQVLGINPLNVAIDTRTETPYEAHPRRRIYVSNDDGNVNDWGTPNELSRPTNMTSQSEAATSSSSHQDTIPGGNNPQNNDDKNKKINFRRAPITRTVSEVPNAFNWLRTPINGASPLRTFAEYMILGGGAGYGLYELFDNDNESRPTRIEVPQNPNNTQTDTRNFDGMNIPIDSLFNLL